jgi:hypothetical protein
VRRLTHDPRASRGPGLPVSSRPDVHCGRSVHPLVDRWSALRALEVGSCGPGLPVPSRPDVRCGRSVHPLVDRWSALRAIEVGSCGPGLPVPSRPDVRCGRSVHPLVDRWSALRAIEVGSCGPGLPVSSRPDVHCGPPGLRSLRAGCASPSWLRWPARPGSRTRATPRARAIPRRAGKASPARWRAWMARPRSREPSAFPPTA